MLPLAIEVRDASDVARLHRAVAAALEGGPAVAPYGPGGMPALDPDDATPLPDDVAAVLRTSGSTGEPRAVLLDASALLASAHATRDRLGPGRWLLALPAQHVAGLQVLVRSVVEGTDPVVLPPGAFDPGTLLEAARRMPDLRVSLVPTQLHRLLGSGLDLAPLCGAILLLGGAATPSSLLTTAREAGLTVVTTYGMTETAGGCVYDGVPLDGVDVALHDGVVRLAGPVLARGYHPAPAPHDDPFVEVDGRRWFRTSDLGRLHDGVLEVLGRADDVVVTGGVNVAPTAVERVLDGVPGVGQVCVVGVPDPEWGQALTAVVVADGTPPSLEDLRAAARTLGRAAAPRHLVLVGALDETGPGKVDRAAVARRARAEVAARTREDRHGDGG